MVTIWHSKRMLAISISNVLFIIYDLIWGNIPVFMRNRLHHSGGVT
jgi:hypothetical protein